MSRSSKRDQRNRVPTRKKLARALAEAGAPPPMVQAAGRGVYDPVWSNVMDPVAALIHDARKEGLEQIALRAQTGEWNGQEWERAEWLNASDVAQEVAQWNGIVRAMRRDGKV